MSNYMNYMRERPELIESLRLYVEEGVMPGSFLSAVLENDLREACNRADFQNQRHIFEVVAYCYNEIPGAAWGSREKVAAWIKLHEDCRKEKEKDA